MPRQDNRAQKIVIYGRNTVMEALKSKVPLQKVLLYKKLDKSDSQDFESLARKREIEVSFKEKEQMEDLTLTDKNQGVAAILTDYKTLNLNESLDYLGSLGENRLLVILDSISDPQNLGSIIRTSEALGVNLIVITQDRSSPLSPTVFKVSQGAIFHLQIAKLPNLNNFMRQIKDLGFWIYGFEANASKYFYESKLKGDIALVFGSEGKGLRELTRKTCDFLVKIPMKGVTSSLNVSVSAALGIFEVYRQKEFKK